MNRKATDSIVTVIGVDIGKNTFHLVGLDARGAIVLRQKLSRGQVAARLANGAAVPDWDGGLRRRPPFEPAAP